MTLPGEVADPSTIDASDVRFASGVDEVDAYLARPVSAGSYPAIVVIHEAFGPNEHIRDLTRRFAAAGFVAFAPDLYHRVGLPDVGDIGSVLTAMWSVRDADVVADIEAATGYLRGLDGVDGRVGCIGFCSGGRQTLLVACSSTTVDAAIDCWGGFVDRASPDDVTTPARPTPVLDLVSQLSCPLFAVGGAEDENPSPAVLADLGERASAAGKDVTVEVFEGAGHAFLADYRDSYRPGPAHELWPKLIEFFDGHLR